MNRQEVFDKVYVHLLTQNVASLNEDKSCAYRGLKGRMCAVGCLITDDAYSFEIEGYPVDNIGVVEALEKSGILVESVSDEWFLRDLQIIHDIKLPVKWETALKEFAQREQLTVPQFTKETK